MKVYFSNGSINISGISSSHHTHNMLYMHIEMRFNEGFSYFGPLGHHFHDLTECPHKVGPGASNVDGSMACTSIINESVCGASKLMERHGKGVNNGRRSISPKTGPRT
jgi:hypothetical protein